MINPNIFRALALTLRCWKNLDSCIGDSSYMRVDEDDGHDDNLVLLMVTDEQRKQPCSVQRENHLSRERCTKLCCTKLLCAAKYCIKLYCTNSTKQHNAVQWSPHHPPAGPKMQWRSITSSLCSKSGLLPARIVQIFRHLSQYLPVLLQLTLTFTFLILKFPIFCGFRNRSWIQSWRPDLILQAQILTQGDGLSVESPIFQRTWRLL